MDKSYPKVIAQYLPQFHEIPENSLWWGEGYTDWVAVKKATPQFDGHRQPRIPLEGYYSLDQSDVIRRQVELANEFGVYGFGIYHYWFSSEQKLLTKPAEIILDNSDIDTHYMFFWDNGSWKRTWSGLKGNDWAPQFDVQKEGQSGESGILAKLEYGDKTDWKSHFDYLLPYFLDERYIRKDNKPLFGIMQPRNNPALLNEMASFWDYLAKQNGLDGIVVMTCDNYPARKSGATMTQRFRYTPLSPQTFIEGMENKVKAKWSNIKDVPRICNYDKEWQRILRDSLRADDSTYLSGFVSFDDTPRRGGKARIILGSTPEKFEYYYKQLMQISQSRGQEYVFLSAWNEWGEGMYLEPDSDTGYAYLEALSNAVHSLENNYQQFDNAFTCNEWC